MDTAKLQQLKIDRTQRRRSRLLVWVVFPLIGAFTVFVAIMAIPQASDKIRINPLSSKRSATANLIATTTNRVNVSTNSDPQNAPVLTVSGYIIARERIELSPRFLGVVKWIGVKKGDSVTNGQVIVLLDDSEYVAKLREAEARLASAKISLQKAELDYWRATNLVYSGVEMKKLEDDARLQLEAAKAAVVEIERQIDLIKTYIDWTVIRSPVNGVVLERLVDANELVTPQSFGGSRGPSTAVVALADLNDLQIEVDLNETDLSKIYLGQKCKISPEAYLDRVYDGYVAEIAPEANRQKGTLQVKVQVLKPDKFLIPELSAKVDFLK